VTAVRSLPRRACRIAAAATALSCATALAVSALGGGEAARELLAFRFHPPPREPADVLQVAASNARLAAAALLAACAVSARPQLRLPLDVTLGALLAFNAGLVGLAGAAYGARLVAAAALHAPLELAGFAAAGAAYLAARAGELSARGLAGAGAAATSLLAAGAMVETYLRIGAAA
jgi:hypothetical protein